MIHYLMPVLGAAPSPSPPRRRWWQVFARIRPERMVLKDNTIELLNLIDRVRGAEASLARLKRENLR